MRKRVILTLIEGSFEQGFPVILQIKEDSASHDVENQVIGSLPPAPNLSQAFNNWQSAYNQWQSTYRIKPIPGATNFSCRELASLGSQLADTLNNWLNSDFRKWKKIRERLHRSLNETDEIQFIIQTEDMQLRQLPWHLWDFFSEHYTKAEIALSAPEYEPPPPPNPTNKVRILAILGDSTGINVEQDRAILQEQLQNAEITFLTQPQLQILNYQLWEQQWDILFFAGHSASQEDGSTGQIYIQQNDSVSPRDLKNALKKAILGGLQLAIFNSCDGLGLAQEIGDLNIPQIIVMRKPVPDKVAQEFLRHFLRIFASGASLYLAVREARERLQGLEKEFPCASWLPVICQNPAARSLRIWPVEPPPIPDKPTPPQPKDRFRQVLLNKVSNYWVKGVLETSLRGKVLIKLNLEERLDAVEHPWGMVWETPDQLKRILPPGTRVIDKFEQMGAGRSLLILGKPGSGKTTTLLELARYLIDQAEQDVDKPMPVVFHLSSWGSKKATQTIADWLVQELQRCYQVSKKLAWAWVKNQKLLLLLDGLDEVSAERRHLYVRALNRFIQEYGQTQIVITSRIQEYEDLRKRCDHLRLQGAIYLQSLTLEQINDYLTSAGSELEAVKTLLQEDGDLQELAKSPLMLSVMALAYQGMSVQDLLTIKSMENRREHLFNRYIDRMFFRRRTRQEENQHNPNQEQLGQTYPKEKAIQWLVWLARMMSQESQTVFLIEQMQPTWLLTRLQKWIYRIGVVLMIGLLFGLIQGLTYGLMGGLLGSVIVELPSRFAHGLINGLFDGLILGLIILLVSRLRNKEEIKPAEMLKWSWKNASRGFISWLESGYAFGLILGLIQGLFHVLTHESSTHQFNGEPISQLIAGLMSGVILGPTYGLVGSLAGKPIGRLIGRLRLGAKVGPVVRLKERLRHKRIGGVFVGLLGGLLFGLIFELRHGLLFGLIAGLTCGLLVGLTYRLIVGLTERLQHRLIAKLLRGLTDGLLVGLIVGLITGLIGGLIDGLIAELLNLASMELAYGLLRGLTFGLIAGLIGGVIGGLHKLDIEKTTFPNQGIWNSAVNAGKLTLIGGIIAGSTWWLVVWLTGGLPDIPIWNLVTFRIRDARIAGLSGGVSGGLILGLIAMAACIQHLTLRAIFWYRGVIPWNYARFLDYATQRCFLQQVGGGYIFIHRLLLEHFAALEINREISS
jgi:DNA polymerase III delta prime subunit